MYTVDLGPILLLAVSIISEDSDSVRKFSTTSTRGLTLITDGMKVLVD